MIIEYYIKSVYGNENRYIKDEDQAKWIQTLTGMKTLMKHHITALEHLGFTFEEVLAPHN